jgi:pyruvate/2-oxoglutarate dehydrogenase complex dihydrolipoamide dehydrogenase (E3) component
MDLAIIGAGSAAFAAAIRASELGAKVVLVERGTVGANVGCIPSKALLAAADTYHRARRHDFAGIPHLNSAPPDLAALVAQKDALVAARWQAKYLDLIDEYGFELRRGTARFADADTLDVDGQPLRAHRYLIAAGVSPALPPIDGLADVDYLTSTTALELTEMPRRLAVLGAGSVGLELGQAFARLGAQVTFLELAQRIAPYEEPEISAALADILTAGGARIVTGATIKRASQTRTARSPSAATWANWAMPLRSTTSWSRPGERPTPMSSTWPRRASTRTRAALSPSTTICTRAALACGPPVMSRALPSTSMSPHPMARSPRITSSPAPAGEPIAAPCPG